MRAAPPAQRRGAVGRELDGLGVVGDRPVGLAELHVGARPVAVGGGIAGRQQQRAVEVLDRLLDGAQPQQHVAAVVVDGGVFRIELDRPVEVLDRLLLLLAARIGDPAIVEDRRPAVVRQRLVLEHLGVDRDRLVDVAAHQRRGGLAHAQQARVARATRHAGDAASAQRRSAMMSRCAMRVPWAARCALSNLREHKSLIAEFGQHRNAVTPCRHSFGRSAERE